MSSASSIRPVTDQDGRLAGETRQWQCGETVESLQTVLPVYRDDGVVTESRETTWELACCRPL